MLRIVTGPFHPDLEHALVEEIRRLKAADPLAPLAVIVPSDPLRRRVKWLLCAEHQCALLDVHFLTFYQLGVCLIEEAEMEDPACAPASVRPEFFFKELVHHLLRGQFGRDGAWAGLVEMPGAWSALWSTLKDLKDAAVDAERAQEAVAQTALDLEPGSRTSLGRLLRLYRLLVGEKARLNVVDHDDLAVLARDRVPTSNFLRRQLRILYYGFYDLTQVQLDLFQAVARAYPTTLYFPLIKGDPGFLFAQRFFERYIHGLVTEPLQREQLGVRGTVGGEGEGTKNNRAACRIVNVSGRWDEVTVVAKDILGLVEERGYAFHDIGVVARTLSGYETVLPRVFDQHGIPFQSTMGRSLASFPYPKAAAQLLALRVSGFRRDQVMDLLSSPFLRITDLCPSNPPPRPDLWDSASRRVGITKGLESWGRLTTFQETGLPLRDDEDGEGTDLRIPAEQIYGFWTAVSTLSEILRALPETGLWDEYAAHGEAVIDRVLDPRTGDPSGGQVGDHDTVADLFRAGLDELRELGRLGQAVSLADFVAALQRLIEEMTVPLGSAHGSGVQVLDAMAARGLPFRALFILGLNEKVFPRHIHEDAFLRDRVRRVLEVDLGFKIQEKLAGYDEERLLFSLLCSAARHHLTLLYQRADEAGRTLVPSAYLGDMKRAWGGDAEVAVPRRLTKKFREGVQFRLERLTPSELVVKLLLDRRVPRRLLEAGYPVGRIVEQGLAALHGLDSLEPRLGAYDGMTGPLQAYWARLAARGVSPTSLERYVTCPFRYFAEHVLQLEPMTAPETVDQVGPMELGRLAHDILRTCLQTFREEGGFAKPPRSRRDPLDLLNQAARSVFEEFARSHPVGYPLLWELAQEQLLELLRTVLREDLDELAAGGWEPILFEESLDGSVSVPLPDGQEPCRVSGRLDRVDWRASGNEYRVIDYKFKLGKHQDAMDTNLKRGAVRGRRLQPPLYLAMAEATMPARLQREESGRVPGCEGVWFYYLAPNWVKEEGRALVRERFPGDAWSSELRAPLERALGHVLGGIRSGRFFIFPGSYCEQCDYRLLCRKTHQPTAWRARQDHALLASLRELHRANPPEEHPEGSDDAAGARRPKVTRGQRRSGR